MKLFNYAFKALDNLKILVLSDIHYFNYKEDKKLKNIVKHLTTNHYDALFLAGDIIDSINALEDKQNVVKLINFFKQITQFAPTYLVYASHDMAYYDQDEKRLVFKRKMFEEKLLTKLKEIKNLYFLENQTYNLTANITVTLIDPELKYKEDNKNRLKDYEFLKNLDSKKTNLLLCHYPDFVTLLAQNNYLSKIKLAISGHNHNGMTQLKFLPIESVFNLFGQNNRGIITPEKTFNLKDTKNLRGLVKLNEKSQILINPAFTSLAHCTHFLNHFDCLFYKGASIIEFKQN